MSATYTPEDLIKTFRLKKYYRLKRLEDFDAADYEKLFTDKTFEQRSLLMFQIVKSKGNPLELLGNSLDRLRQTGLDENMLEIIAIHLIFAKVYTDPEETKTWKEQIKAYQNFIKTPYAQKRPDLIKDIESEIVNLKGRFYLDFLSEAIGILMEVLPLESKRIKSVVISEQLKELDIRIYSDFYTLTEATDEAARNDTYQDGVSIIYDRIKKYDYKYKKMIERTIALKENYKL
jgi:hypothetical protein